MEKLAQTQYPIHELLQRRWSPRAFSEQPVSPEQVRSLLEAARWAPSSNNEQPWHFLIAMKHDQTDYEQLLSCLKPTNQMWARLAPMLAISIAKLVFTDGGERNRHALHDVGLAVENLVVQATAIGLIVHQMAGIYPDKVQELYRIPGDYEVVAAIAIGYPGDPAYPINFVNGSRLHAFGNPLPTSPFQDNGNAGHRLWRVNEGASRSDGPMVFTPDGACSIRTVIVGHRPTPA